MSTMIDLLNFKPLSINYDMLKKYVHFIEDLMILNSIFKINNFHKITDLEDFREFRKNNLITMKDAKLVDMYFYGKCGNYWLSAYDYPKENEEIYKNGCFVGESYDVGILTFNIHNQL